MTFRHISALNPEFYEWAINIILSLGVIHKTSPILKNCGKYIGTDLSQTLEKRVKAQAKKRIEKLKTDVQTEMIIEQI